MDPGALLRRYAVQRAGQSLDPADLLHCCKKFFRFKNKGIGLMCVLFHTLYDKQYYIHSICGKIFEWQDFTKVLNEEQH